MKRTLTQYIDAYESTGRNVEGMRIYEVQILPGNEQMEILEDAKGRDIVATGTKGILDGQWYKYEGKENPNFDIESIFVAKKTLRKIFGMIFLRG